MSGRDDLDLCAGKSRGDVDVSAVQEVTELTHAPRSPSEKEKEVHLLHWEFITRMLLELL
jgi:hypothetical protein